MDVLNKKMTPREMRGDVRKQKQGEEDGNHQTRLDCFFRCLDWTVVEGDEIADTEHRVFWIGRSLPGPKRHSGCLSWFD